MTDPVLNHMPQATPEETTTLVYARVNGTEMPLGVLRVIPGVNAAVDVDPQALMIARQTLTVDGIATPD